MITVTIAGTDRTRLVDYYSLVITSVKTDTPDTCSFIIKKFGDRDYIPSVNEEVIITDASATRIFAGHIISVDEVYDTVNIVGYKVKCADYTRMMDNKLIVDVYENMTVSEIIDDIKANYLDNSITVNCDVDTEIKYIAFNYEYPSDALRQLAEASESDWYIDYNKVIQFFVQETRSASFGLTDTNGKYIYDSLFIRRKLSQLRNIVYVRGGEFKATTTTAAFEADGIRRDFFLPHKFSNLTVTVTGQQKSVGIDPIDEETNYDALHNFQEKFVRFRDNKKPSAGSEVRIGGQPNIPVLVKMRDTDSIETFTVREYVVIDKSIKSKEGARQRALAELLTYRTTVSEARFRTYETGLKVGQKINVQSTLRGLDEDYIINRIQASIFGTDASDKSVKLEYNVELVTIRTFNYIQLLKSLINQRKKEIVISDDEILDEVEQIDEDVTIQDTVTASIDHNPQTEDITIDDDDTVQDLDYPTKFVLTPYTPDPVVDTLQQSIDPTGYTSYQIYGARKWGQRFTPSSTYKVGKYGIYTGRTGSPGTVNVYIYLADGSGFPTGDPLASASFDGDAIDTSITWVEGYFDEAYELQSGTEYVFYFEAASGNSTNRLDTGYMNANQVAGENLVYDSGSGWTNYASYEALYRIYENDIERPFVIEGSRLS